MIKMPQINDLIMQMVAYYAGDPKRIQHFIKVHSFAKLIGEDEGLDTKTQEILETAAVVHDIGIKNSEVKYHSSAGNYQELEGPPEAEKMLSGLSYPDEIIRRVCWLVGHHHTYSNITEIDHRILVEADFLVNLYEDGAPVTAAKSAKEKVFATETGKRLLTTMYLNTAQA